MSGLVAAAASADSTEGTLMRDSDELPQKLRKRLNELPERTETEWEATPAAVLVPFFREENEWHLLMTKRTENLNAHRGQVSFPGGAIEPRDRSPVETALREAQEEIGLPPERVKILGQLNSLLTVTQYHVTPVVAAIPWPFDIVLNPNEVASAFGVPLSWLMDGGNLERRERETPLPGGRPIGVYYFEPYQGHVIWGVTAYIIVNLLEHIRALWP